MGGKGFNCIQNTYYFNITEANNLQGDNGVVPEMNFAIPSLPTFPRGESKTAIFRLLSATIGNQTNTDNIANNSGIFVEVSGLSLRPQMFSGTDLKSTNRFWIPNQHSDKLTLCSDRRVPTYDIAGLAANGDGVAGGNQRVPQHDITPLGNDITYNTQTGGELFNPYELICGNPSGNTGNIKLFDEHGVVLAPTLGALANLCMNISFSIELIPPDQDQNL